jgi:hypothetical protein
MSGFGCRKYIRGQRFAGDLGPLDDKRFLGDAQ